MSPVVLVAAVLVVVAGACQSGSEPAPLPSPERGGSAAKTTWYVATTGDEDGTGSFADPFPTVEEGLEAVGPGESLVIAGGTYDERIRAPDIAAGSPEAPVTVTAAEGERVVIRGLLWLEDPSWWVLDGINVTWSADNRKSEHMVKLTGGVGWVFQNAEVWGAASYAAILVAGDPVDFVLRELYVHDTADVNGTNQDHLLYLNSGTGGGLVERCLLVGSPNGRAIKVGPDDDDGRPVANVTIRFNTMVDNRGPSNIQLAYRSEGIIIERNIMVGAADGRANVTTFRLSGEGNVVRQNLGWDATGVLEEDDRDALDGGGNRRVDPQLDEHGVPQEPAAVGYGHVAP